MSTQIITPSQLITLPPPRVAINIRPGTVDDIAFMDGLQRTTTKQVGWMPTKQFEGKVAAGHVLVAWASRPCSSEDTGETPVVREDIRVGYLIGNDQYFKRDDVGIIYQINVCPEFRRSLVAASLLRAQFERSAYGCKLYCCWCAQDIEANRFWESMGFVPLAFRAGSEKKSRVHIFWQKRIRSNDTTTPWWFPSKTDGGAIREDRIVLPIPPGTHWSDAKPIVLPGAEGDSCRVGFNPPSLPDAKNGGLKPTLRKKAKAEVAPPPPVKRVAQFGPPGAVMPVAPVVETPKVEATPVEKPKRVSTPRTKKKADPKFVAAARELRDRYLDEVNAGRHVIEPVAAKYDVGRALSGASVVEMKRIAA